MNLSETMQIYVTIGINIYIVKMTPALYVNSHKLYCYVNKILELYSAHLAGLCLAL